MENKGAKDDIFLLVVVPRTNNSKNSDNTSKVKVTPAALLEVLQFHAIFLN